MTENAGTLLSLVDADGAFIRVAGEAHSIGRTPSLSVSSSLMSTLKSTWIGDVGCTDQLGKYFPVFSDSAVMASGVLMLHLSGQDDGILWFRGELVQTVQWAGDPSIPKYRDESSTRMSPRKSFASWQQTQRGRALQWTAKDLDAAREMHQTLVKNLLRRAEMKLEKVAFEDTLTGLFNRNALMERLAKWQNGSGPRAATLLFLDLDDFTRINDQLGYRAGDELLREVGQRLSLLTNQEHFIARLSGDEFAVFCEDLDLSGAEKLANVIARGLAEPLFVAGGFWRLTASIGIAPVQPNQILGWVLKDPLRAADSAMYVAKHKGGNQVSIVDGRQHAKVLQCRIDEDLAKRQLTANELASAYVQLNSVMDSTSQGILQISHDWSVVYGNRRAAEILPEFDIGIDCWKCFPALLSGPAEQHLRKAMTSRSESKFQIDDPSSAGCYELNVFSTRNGLTIFFSDISEEKRIKDQLVLEQLLREKRIEALSHMAGTLAHEISNPLAIIHGKASDLATLAAENKPLDPVNVLAACSTIVKTANQASSILRGLRGFAREGEQDAMELASIYEMVGECVDAQSDRFQQHNIEIRVALTAGIPNFVCREVQIGQILTNLLNNAFDEINRSEGTERWVTITAALLGGNIHLEVTDSGPGIEDRFRAHLMEPFFTTKPFGAGMGVGLSLSRAIAQDHGGSLSLLEDTAHTCFCLVLPGRLFRRRLSDQYVALEVPYEAA
jgi:diguanylate cyclase (GGDEF)-like protein